MLGLLSSQACVAHESHALYFSSFLAFYNNQKSCSGVTDCLLLTTADQYYQTNEEGQEEQGTPLGGGGPE